MYKIRHRANFKDTIYKFVLPSQELIPYRYQYWKTGDYKMTIVFPVYIQCYTGNKLFKECTIH